MKVSLRRLKNMTDHLKEEYRGMHTVCKPYRNPSENNKTEIIWKIQAYDDNSNLRGEWDFTAMRVDPHNPNPSERFYIAPMSHILQSGRDLVDRILAHK
jgi:hypothetical protein